MTRIVGPTGSDAAGRPAGPVVALLAQLPAALRNLLTAGSLLNGTVVNRDGSGMTMLQTSAGMVGVKTTAPLPPGSTVTLRVQSAGAQLHAVVLSVMLPEKPVRGPSSARSDGTRRPPAASGPATASAPTSAPAARAGSPTGTPFMTPVTATGDGPIGPPRITATVIGPPGNPVPAQWSTVPVVPPTGPSRAQTPLGPQLPSPGSGNRTAPVTPDGSGTPDAGAVTSSPPRTDAQAAARSDVPGTTPLRPAAGSPPATTPPQPGSTTAVPTTAAPPGHERPSPETILPSGSQVQVRLVPGPAPSPSPQPTAPASGSKAQAGLPGQPAAPAANAPARSQLGLQGTATPAVLVQASVVMRTPAGQTVIDTPLGRMSLRLPPDAPSLVPGETIQLEISLPDKPADPSRISRPIADHPAALARDWPALKEVVRVLGAMPDNPAGAALERMLPRPGPQLAQQILAFVAGASRGSIRAWLGEATARLLEDAAGDGLFAKLDRDIAEMPNARQSGSGEWTLTVVPFADGQALRQIRFFERRRKQDDPSRRPGETVRFVVECEHSAFGELQLDGLVQDDRMDLVLRSHAALPDDMTNDIRGIFERVCAVLHLGGQFTFQAMPAFPVSPLDDYPADAVEVSV